MPSMVSGDVHVRMNMNIKHAQAMGNEPLGNATRNLTGALPVIGTPRWIDDVDLLPEGSDRRVVPNRMFARFWDTQMHDAAHAAPAWVRCPVSVFG